MQLAPVSDSCSPPEHTSGPQSALLVGAGVVGCWPGGHVNGIVTHALRLLAPMRDVVLPGSHSRQSASDDAPDTEV